MNVLQEHNGRLSGLEQLQALIATKRQPPICATLQFELVEVEKGRAVFAGTPGPHAFNPIGSVHGGYAATLLDSACGCAAHSCLSAEQGYTTVELKIAYHKAITGETGLVRAEGKIMSIGRRVAFTEARLIDAEGRLYASATSTLLIFEQPTRD
ncbi:PaaI family thioesterase [Dongia soli]|uniref:PaaI family thioesterase n=1 Tax=Dongia soli TaxID=600628 RepID=A0ABU5EEM0_9PROT|nr:PaaI family thioesterase [Dongia soli]MDY0884791.1 PaaI family thioesterase [Dongia soli]